jgi:hypothetical protein
MTQPMFYITSRTDSGIDLPNLDLTDEKLISKYGSDLTANFADIRAHGSKAFYQKVNVSTETTYSLCACATGYIWVYVSPNTREAMYPGDSNGAEVQIGTFSLKSKAITTIEIPCLYSSWDCETPGDGQLALLCATVLAKYLRFRTMGQQYEEAAEKAICESRQELSPLAIVERALFNNFDDLLQQICTNAPLPPTSNVSLISRGMITSRWGAWRQNEVLRKRYFFPKRVIQCFRTSQHDAIDLFSGTFAALLPNSKKS